MRGFAKEPQHLLVSIGGSEEPTSCVIEEAESATLVLWSLYVYNPVLSVSPYSEH
jgi:hypothetical protein